MKTLFLLRHAQAANAQNGKDIDRPLTDSGRDDAKALGVYMSSKNYMPDLVLCSTALRTKQTFDIFSNAFDALKVQHSEDIYHAAYAQLLEIVQNQSAQNLMVIGHNPTIYEMAARLGERGNERLISRLSQGYQPATLSVFNAEIDNWADLTPDVCTLTDLVNPMDYNAAERPTRWM